MEMVEVFAQTAARTPTTTQLFNIIKYFALSSLHTKIPTGVPVCMYVCACLFVLRRCLLIFISWISMRNAFKIKMLRIKPHRLIRVLALI